MNFQAGMTKWNHLSLLEDENGDENGDSHHRGYLLHAYSAILVVSA